MSDAFTDGRRFRILAVIDDYSRECLALVADTSLSGARVAGELDAIIAERGGKPKTIVSDNGTEFTSMAILKWCQDTKLAGITSLLASRNRTALLRASMAALETNA